MAGCGIAMAQVADSAVREALPKGCRPLYNSFDHRRLTDNLASWDSIFLQPGNAAYLGPIRAAIEAGVMKHLTNKNGLMSGTRAVRWVRREEEILAACLGNYLMFSPMPARDFQIKGLSHQGFEQEGRARNLIILNGRICVVNPPMKGVKGDRKRAEALWALAEMICKPFAFCMGILRPIFTIVLGQLVWDVSLRDRHIFVHAEHSNRWKDPGIFTGSDVNKALQTLTLSLPVKLTAGMLRHFSTVMFQQHFSEILEVGISTAESLVDRLGQHKHATTSTHYSHVQTQSSQLGMLLPRARNFLELCEVYQAAFGVGTLSVRSEDSVYKSQIFGGRKYEDIAFKEAQVQVGSHYQLGGADMASVATTARGLLESKPYMVWESSL